MSQAYDYNGHVVAPSAPKKVLRTVKKTIHIDSADRDTSRYHTNGDWVAYLPRTYKNVTKIHLKSAQFPPLISLGVTPTSRIVAIEHSLPVAGFATVFVVSTSGFSVGTSVTLTDITQEGRPYAGSYIIQSIPSPTTFTILSTLQVNTRAEMLHALSLATISSINTAGALIHSYINGSNTPTAIYSNDRPIVSPNYYFTMEFAGLNKIDQTVVGSNKSTLVDSFFAKIPAMTQTYGQVSFIEYNENSNHDTTAVFSPPVESLDRLAIQIRLHSQQDDNSGFIYWTSDGKVPTDTNRSTSSEYNLTLEIEMLENGFDEFSSFETRIRQ